MFSRLTVTPASSARTEVSATPRSASSRWMSAATFSLSSAADSSRRPRAVPTYSTFCPLDRSKTKSKLSS